ncbi:DUF3052 family protein [Niabella sp.]|uniref:DUF3052 family protein n=1 Tax=Niabella sp. TaxID=1962976 RepID=UPI002609F524|nr:DUF3052 family protein [Niabella sp.]
MSATKQKIQLTATGYSGTPLIKKLGAKPGFKIKCMQVPDHYFELLGALPEHIKISTDRKTKKDLIHFFTTSAAQLNKELKQLRQEIEENGTIWISWPKKSAKVPTDLDENRVRDMALQNGLVDVKVCAIDETWSALKLVIRLKDRR